MNKKRVQSYTGTECPRTIEHGPMLSYPGGVYYCPNQGHSAIGEPGIFVRKDGQWLALVDKALVPVAADG